MYVRYANKRLLPVGYVTTTAPNSVQSPQGDAPPPRCVTGSLHVICQKKTTGKNQYVSLISPNASRERFTAIPIFSRAIYRTLCRDLPKKNSDELCLQNRRFVVFYVEPITLRNAT